MAGCRMVGEVEHQQAAEEEVHPVATVLGYVAATALAVAAAMAPVAAVAAMVQRRRRCHEPKVPGRRHHHLHCSRLRILHCLVRHDFAMVQVLQLGVLVAMEPERLLDHVAKAQQVERHR